MSATDAPSFWACLTDEFIKTVQRDPRSTGYWEKSPRSAKSAISYPIDLAKVSINEPQPEEQASFNMMLSIELLRTLKHLMSCPPMSRIKSTSGSKCRAARKWAIVSTIPSSTRKALRIRSSPYPVTTPLQRRILPPQSLRMVISCSRMMVTGLPRLEE